MSPKLKCFRIDRKPSRCLTDGELDRALQDGLPGQTLRSRVMYDFMRGMANAPDIRRSVEDRLTKYDEVYVPILVRSHWILVVLSRHGKELRAMVYDSAPSPPVARDTRWALRSVFKTDDAQFGLCPRQITGSNECGWHVVANAVAHKMKIHRWFIVKEQSLGHLRKSDPLWSSTVNALSAHTTIQGGGTEHKDPAPKTEEKHPLSEENIYTILKAQPPGTNIRVVWRYTGLKEETTWFGHIFEREGRLWPCQYDFIDESDDRRTIVQSQLPRQLRYGGHEVDILEVAIVPSRPTGHRVRLPTPPKQIPSNVKRSFKGPNEADSNTHETTMPARSNHAKNGVATTAHTNTAPSGVAILVSFVLHKQEGILSTVHISDNIINDKIRYLWPQNPPFAHRSNPPCAFFGFFLHENVVSLVVDKRM